MACGGGFEDALDAEGLATDVEERLVEVFAGDTPDADVVVEHAEIKVRFVPQLDFDVAEGAVGATGQEIDAGVADFREFDVGPIDDFAEEEFGEDAAGVAEEQLEGDVEGLGHGAIMTWRSK